MSLPAICKKHNLSYNQLYYYLKIRGHNDTARTRYQRDHKRARRRGLTVAEYRGLTYLMATA
jgi:hypothetical protein